MGTWRRYPFLSTASRPSTRFIVAGNRSKAWPGSACPKKFLTVFREDNRPQTRLDRDLENGMGISVGRLREDCIFDYKFASLSHNTLRGAAGGAVLMAELLVHQGYIEKK